MQLHELFVFLRLGLGRGDHPEEKGSQNQYTCHQKHALLHLSSHPFKDFTLYIKQKVRILVYGIFAKIRENLLKTGIGERRVRFMTRNRLK
jgi:hypothetical protein